MTICRHSFSFAIQQAIGNILQGGPSDYAPFFNVFGKFFFPFFFYLTPVQFFVRPRVFDQTTKSRFFWGCFFFEQVVVTLRLVVASATVYFKMRGSLVFVLFSRFQIAFSAFRDADGHESRIFLHFLKSEKIVCSMRLVITIRMTYWRTIGLLVFLLFSNFQIAFSSFGHENGQKILAFDEKIMVDNCRLTGVSNAHRYQASNIRRYLLSVSYRVGCGLWVGGRFSVGHREILLFFF